MDMDGVVADERILDKYRKVSVFTLADSHKEVSILCDLGANVLTTPLKEDLRNT